MNDKSQLNQEAFLNVLNQLISLNRKLLSLFREERECLIRNDMEGLRHINTQEMTLGGEISDWEKKREALVRQFKNDFNITNENVHICDIIASVEEPYRSLYEERGNELKALLMEIMKVRNLNNRVIEKMLRFSEKNVKLFLKLGKKDLNYDQTGTMNHSNKQALNTVV